MHYRTVGRRVSFRRGVILQLYLSARASKYEWILVVSDGLMLGYELVTIFFFGFDCFDCFF